MEIKIPRNYPCHSSKLFGVSEDVIIIVARYFDNTFIANYKQFANDGKFAKSSDKAFPVLSDIHIMKRMDKPILDFNTDRVYQYELVKSFKGLENGSCLIPFGFYDLVFNHSPKFNKVMPYLTDVPSRSGIMFHVGNYASDSKGCILIGSFVKGTSIINSQVAFRSFMSILEPFKFNKTIRVLTCDSKDIIP